MKDIEKSPLFTEITDEEAATISGGGFFGAPWDTVVGQALSLANPCAGVVYGVAGVTYDLYRLNNGTYSEMERVKRDVRQRNGGRLVAS